MVNDKKIEFLLSNFDKIFDDIAEKLAFQTQENFKNKEHQITFSLTENLEDIKKKSNMLSNEAGLYLFEINLKEFYKNEMKSVQVWKDQKNSTKRKHFFNCLETLWSESDERKNSTYPKLIKKRFKKHYCFKPYKNSFEDNEWVPLYLGINKNLQKRVFQHIKCDSSTFSMKLSHLSETAFKEIPVRVSISVIPNIDYKSRYILVKEIEKKLRDEIHPLVGKQ